MTGIMVNLMLAAAMQRVLQTKSWQHLALIVQTLQAQARAARNRLPTPPSTGVLVAAELSAHMCLPAAITPNSKEHSIQAEAASSKGKRKHRDKLRKLQSADAVE